MVRAVRRAFAAAGLTVLAMAVTAPTSPAAVAPSMTAATVASVQPINGQTVGVAHPIVVTFRKPVTDRIGLDQMSWAVPSRWGYAAQASTVDLWTIEPGPLAPKDRHFKHTAGTWLFDVGMLVLLTVVYAGIVGWRSRLKRH